MMLFKDVQGYWIIKYKKRYYRTYCRQVDKAIMLVLEHKAKIID